MKKSIDVNSVRLPADFSERRSLRHVNDHLDGSKLDDYDLAQYDNNTIFYDVFFDIKNRFLYTVGPPFLNLRKSLFPISIKINDNKKQVFHVDEYFDGKIAIGRTCVKKLRLREENIIEFDFNGRFEWSGRIELNKHEIKPVILTTIQKENRVRWIKEWMGFYSQHYNIDQTIIYDNNSSNRNDLLSITNDNLLLIAWDFKYGPIRSHDNQFCQLGSLNHCRLKFGVNNIIMNFDLDELLFLNKTVFKEFTHKYNISLFNAYRVPFIKPVSEDYSYINFSFRDRDPQEGGRKYFYKPSNVICNNIHSALLKRPRFSLFKKLETKYYRLCGVNNKGRIHRCLLKLISIILKLRIVPINEAYFLHYTGITNNWKFRYWDRKEEIHRSDNHIKFDLMDLQ